MRYTALISAAVLLALASAVLAGPVLNPDSVQKSVACCVRSFLRNTDRAPDSGSRFNAEPLYDLFDGAPDGKPTRDGVPGYSTDGKFGSTTTANGIPMTVKSGGDVIPLDTHCVDSEMKAFKNFVEFNEVFREDADVFGPRDVEGKYRCTVRSPDGPSRTFFVDDHYDCLVMQECNNHQQDVSACAEACEAECYGGRTTKKIPNRRGDGETLECYDYCRLDCEYNCVGACLNDPECIFECVFGEGNPKPKDGVMMTIMNRRSADGYNFDRRDFPNLLLDFLYGYESHTFNLEHLSPKREVSSASRPHFSVRRNELELTMAVFPGSKCSDIRYMCNSGVR